MIISLWLWVPKPPRHRSILTSALLVLLILQTCQCDDDTLEPYIFYARKGLGVLTSLENRQDDGGHGQRPRVPRFWIMEVWSNYCHDKDEGDYVNPGKHRSWGDPRCTFVKCSWGRTFVWRCSPGSYNGPTFPVTSYGFYQYSRFGIDFCRYHDYNRFCS